MKLNSISKILGMMLIVFSATYLPPIIVELIYKDGSSFPFYISFLITIFTGVLVCGISSKKATNLKHRDSFLIAALFWVVLSIVSAIPFKMTLIESSIVDSIFEAVSGLTTTGISIIKQIDTLPHSILFYRQQLHFLGGMGIMLLAVAILPRLRTGGNQLCHAESTWQSSVTKLTPKITSTAKILWYIYITITFLGIISFKLAGMGWFDAICASFSTASTGGFAIHGESFAFYNSNKINVIAMCIMLLATINFSLHFQAIKHKKFSIYMKDYELTNYFLYLFIASLITLIVLAANHVYELNPSSIISSVFAVVSIGTTTGITIDSIQGWPSLLPYMFIIMSIIGGCSGSTSGGVKFARCLIAKNLAKKEIEKLIHPYVVSSLKFGNNVVENNILKSVCGFLILFVSLFVFLVLLLITLGVDPKLSLGAIAACLSNTGVIVFNSTHNLYELSQSVKWVLMFAMIAGRLEIFTFAVLLSRKYWKE